MSLYGVSTKLEKSAITLVPVPWDATTSYGSGASKGPQAILQASVQLDLDDSELGNVSDHGLYYLDTASPISDWNSQARTAYEEADMGTVNRLTQKTDTWVEEQTDAVLSRGQIPGILGGDHSSPFGALTALGKKRNFGILHFDAHYDLRKAYQGCFGSHASIMRRTLEKIPAIERIVSVGIRDFCEEELTFAKENRVTSFLDRNLKERLHAGENWKKISSEIADALPEAVWVSFDIDGLDPKLCPSTGTPVPGGLDFWEAVCVLKTVYESGRKIIGFDLCEVTPGPNEWDANVGMRILYQLCGWTLATQKRITPRP